MGRVDPADVLIVKNLLSLKMISIIQRTAIGGNAMKRIILKNSSYRKNSAGWKHGGL